MKYKLNRYADFAIEEKLAKSLITSISGKNIDISEARPYDSWNCGSTALYSTFYDGMTKIKIVDFIGFKGYGTLILNTWINLAKYLSFAPEKITVTGEIVADDINRENNNNIEFYERFGFNFKGDRKKGGVISAKLTDLKVMPNKDDQSDFFFKAFMFSPENSDELLSNLIASFKDI